MQSHTARVINMFILFNPGNLNLEIHPKKISQWQKKKKFKEKSIDTKMLIVTLSLQEKNLCFWGQNPGSLVKESWSSDNWRGLKRLLECWEKSVS